MLSEDGHHSTVSLTVSVQYLRGDADGKPAVSVIGNAHRFYDSAIMKL